jgi:hypothetical protein
MDSTHKKGRDSNTLDEKSCNPGDETSSFSKLLNVNLFQEIGMLTPRGFGPWVHHSRFRTGGIYEWVRLEISDAVLEWGQVGAS